MCWNIGKLLNGRNYKQNSLRYYEFYLYRSDNVVLVLR